MEELIKRLERVIQTGVPDKDGMHPISAETVLEVVKELSELSTNLAEVGTNVPDNNVGELISRQAAIDALRNYLVGKNVPCDGTLTCRLIENEVINKLPPIQPEIVRCKDCKHHWTYKCMDSMPIERCDLGQTFYDAEVDFCSLAEKREVTT